MAKAPTAPSSWLAIYAGTQCLGHIIKRGMSGVEAFDFEDRPLGLYPDQRAAAAAVTEAARVA